MEELILDVEEFAKGYSIPGLPYYVAIHYVRKLYCAKLKKRGVCTSCKTCQPYLWQIKKIKPTKSPHGLLTWICRNMSGKYIDEHPVVEEQVIDQISAEVLNALQSENQD